MKSRNIILIFFTYINFYQNVKSFQLRSSGIHDSGFYKAAVYEHPVIPPAKAAESYEEAVEQMMLNLNEYKKQANIAGSQDVDIIVFPEDGIYGYAFPDPEDIEAYLEFIPNPAEVNWTPCIDHKRYNRTKVQRFLSCLAMNNSLYLVANYGDAQPCASRDPNCPKNGQYQYNTNVVFDRKGKLIARYHKEHLYYETQFQVPANPERVYFDTAFGRFGTFTCFDILFYEPAIPLVEQFGITDVLFPTAWMDALPYFSAIGFHSAFATAYNVNFLSANLHLPSRRFQGSGIYTPNGAIKYIYDKTSSHGQLLVSEVPILKNTKDRKISFTFGTSEIRYLKEHEFQGKVRHDMYNFVSLTSRNENMTVCQNGFCCFLLYQRDHVTDDYAFGVFFGRYKNRTYHLQMCVLLKCAPKNNQECGKDPYAADGYFNVFTIRGNFSTPYVTPQIITSTNGSLELPPLNSMKYDMYGLTGHAGTKPLFHSALVGRLYDERPVSTSAQQRFSRFYIFAQLCLLPYIWVLVA